MVRGRDRGGPLVDEQARRIAGRLALLAGLGSLLLAGCGGTVTGTPAQLVHRAPARTFAAGSAHLDQSSPGLTRAGDVELQGSRAELVEHGRFGYREYRYLGNAWFQLGGEIGDVGEDLGGKWVVHPRAGAPDDVLAGLERDVRSLARARNVRKLKDGAFAIELDGARATVRLDSRGRLRELHRGTLLLALSHFGTGVDVERPPADQMYVGHD